MDITSSSITFPFDIWLAISQYLSIKDIVALQATSKLCRAYMNEQSVWSSAWLDILAVKPLPYLQAEVPQLTCEELKAACVRAATVEQAFTHGVLQPRAVASAEGAFVQVCLLPGGKRYIAITTRGGLELYDVHHQEAKASTPAPVDAPPARTDIRILPRTSREVLVLHALHWDRDPDYDGHTETEFWVYALSDRFTLLRSYRPSIAQNIVNYGLFVHEGVAILCFLRGRYEREYIVEVYFMHNEAVDRTIIVRLRGWIMCSYVQDFLPLLGSVSLLSPSRLLFAASEGIYLYDLPSANAATSVSAVDAPKDVWPVWTTYSRWLTRAPILSPPIGYNGQDPRARCMLWTGKDVLDLDLPLGSITNNSRLAVHIVHQQYNQAYIHLGNCSGVQYPSAKIVNAAFSMVFGRGCESGHLRLGRGGPCIKTARLESSKITEGVDSICGVSTDEYSGRMSVLDAVTGHLAIYDLV